jgi:hypothetical protein
VKTIGGEVMRRNGSHGVFCKTVPPAVAGPHSLRGSSQRS